MRQVQMITKDKRIEGVNLDFLAGNLMDSKLVDTGSYIFLLFTYSCMYLSLSHTKYPMIC